MRRERERKREREREERENTHVRTIRTQTCGTIFIFTFLHFTLFNNEFTLHFYVSLSHVLKYAPNFQLQFPLDTYTKVARSSI